MLTILVCRYLADSQSALSLITEKIPLYSILGLSVLIQRDRKSIRDVNFYVKCGSTTHTLTYIFIHTETYKIDVLTSLKCKLFTDEQLLDIQICTNPILIAIIIRELIF